MKLNPDCIRDILFVVEDLSKPNSIITSDQLFKTESLSKYSEEEVLYHLNQLQLSGYIIVPTKNRWIDGTYLLNDLSPSGHEFISNVRKDTNWNKVKSISKEVGTETLSSLKSIAENVISSTIQSLMGLNKY